MNVTIHFNDDSESRYHTSVSEMSVIPVDDEYPKGEVVIHDSQGRFDYELTNIKQISTQE